MPRESKCRRVCGVPENRGFLPQLPCSETVLLTVEELEALRLCDLEGLEQDEAAVNMNVSRGTFQRILYHARKAVAEALCGGKAIAIDGGHYEVLKQPCACRGKCRGCRFRREPEKEEKSNGK